MSFNVEYAVRVLAGLAGGWLVITTVSGAIRSFVLPRNESVRLNVFVFSGVRALFDFAARRATTYARRDRILAHYAPSTGRSASRILRRAMSLVAARCLP
jgi:hypothetical protein